MPFKSENYDLFIVSGEQCRFIHLWIERQREINRDFKSDWCV